MAIVAENELNETSSNFAFYKSMKLSSSPSLFLHFWAKQYGRLEFQAFVRATELEEGKLWI